MFLLTLLVITALIIVLVTFWYYRFITHEKKYLRKYKGPFARPLVGNLLDFGDVSDVIRSALSMRDEFGSVVKLWIGFSPRIVVCDAKLSEAVLSSQTLLEKSYEYKFFHSWLGTGLLTSAGTKWRQRRRLLTPAFHFQILEQYIEIFDSQTDTLVKNISKEINRGPFDIFPYISLCALDIICEAAMGTSVNAQNDSESEYVRAVKEICRIIWNRGMSPLKTFDVFFRISKDYWKQKRALQILHGYTESVIIKRREELLEKQANGHKEKAVDDTGIKRRMAFLDILLQSSIDGVPLTNECIREEVDTFMFEGHDTTTSGLSFALYSLSQYPEIQEKVVEELHHIFGDDKTRSPTYQDLQDMKYLELVIKESLRLYPPVPLFSRTLNSDSEVDNQLLPEGITLTIFAPGLHSEPKVFPNPDVFDPERFLPENVSKRSPFAYLPFSAGPRNCIGQRFAMLEMKSTVSKVLRHFELLPVENHKPILQPDVILKSGNGLPIIIKKRQF